jgi:hypothetical protein
MHYTVGNASALQGVEFLHRTTSDAAVKSILLDGFDFSKLGKTGRQHRVPKRYTKYDPIAMFASIKTSLAIEPGTPFVSFEIDPSATIIWHDLESGDFKRALFEEFDVSNHKELTGKLRALGVSAICHVKNEDEIIVLNMDAVKWQQYGRHNEFSKPASSLIGEKKTTNELNISEQQELVSPNMKRGM